MWSLPTGNKKYILDVCSSCVYDKIQQNKHELLLRVVESEGSVKPRQPHFGRCQSEREIEQ